MGDTQIVEFGDYGVFELRDEKLIALVGAAGLGSNQPDDPNNIVCNENVACTNLACGTVNTDCYNNHGCGDSLCW